MPTWGRLPRHLPAIGGYVALTVVALWPAARHFDTRPYVDGIDSSVFSWAWWALPRALADGANPFETQLMFHPEGADLALTTTAPLIGALTWPVRVALGPAAQINTVQLLSTFFTGVATYLLALRVCRHRGAAFVAGMAYTLLPHRFVHVRGHLNLVETGMLPLGLLVLLRFLDRPTWGRSVVLGATAGATFLIDPQLAVFLGIAALILAASRWGEVTAEPARLLAAGVIALAVAAPLLVPMLAAMADGEGGGGSTLADQVLYSSAPDAWVVPPFGQLRMGAVTSWEPSSTPTQEGIAYPGLAMLGLAFAGAGRAPRWRGAWLWLAVVGILLSFGPRLMIGSRLIDVPLPFSLLAAAPGLDALRVPGRFALVGALGSFMLAALGLARVAERRSRHAVVIVGAVGLITLVELFPAALPDVSHAVPPAYEAIADDDGDGAVLEIPLKWSTGNRLVGFDGTDQNFLFLHYAQVHERPVVSGSVSRYPDDRLERLLAEPVYRQVLALGGQPGFDDRARFDQADLERLAIGYVVYHRDDPAPGALRYLRSLDLPVLADDGTVIVWKV